MKVVLTIQLKGLTMSSEPTDLVKVNSLVKHLIDRLGIGFELLSLVPVEDEPKEAWPSTTDLYDQPGVDVGAQEEETALRAREGADPDATW